MKIAAYPFYPPDNVRCGDVGYVAIGIRLIEPTCAVNAIDLVIIVPLDNDHTSFGPEV